MISADGSVPLPEVVPPRLAVAVRYPGDATVCVPGPFATGPTGPSPSTRRPLPATGRDRAAEQQLVEALPGPVGGLPELWTPERRLAESVELTGMEALEFTTEVLPALRADAEVDVTVEGTPTAYRQTTSAPQISFTARDSRGVRLVRPRGHRDRGRRARAVRHPVHRAGRRDAHPGAAQRHLVRPPAARSSTSCGC